MRHRLKEDKVCLDIKIGEIDRMRGLRSGEGRYPDEIIRSRLLSGVGDACVSCAAMQIDVERDEYRMSHVYTARCGYGRGAKCPDEISAAMPIDFSIPVDSGMSDTIRAVTKNQRLIDEEELERVEAMAEELIGFGSW